MIATILLAAALPALAGPDCVQAKAKLEEFLGQLPRTCRKDADCDGYYYRADSHAPPVLLAKPGVREGSKEERELLKRQAVVREACRDEFSDRPASPTPFRAECRSGSCVDGLSSPVLAPAPKKAAAAGEPRWNAVIKHRCAPWDGPALGITLTRSKGGCKPPKGPHLGITLWRKIPPETNVEIDLDDTLQGLGSAARCRTANRCEQPKAAWILLDRFEPEGKVSGRFELTFEDGAEKGAFEADWCPGMPACG